MPTKTGTPDVPDFVFKMLEEIVGLKPGNTIRLKFNNARFSLFRTCYLVPDLETAQKMFVNSFIIKGLDWVSIRYYFQTSQSPACTRVAAEKTPLDMLPPDVSTQYNAARNNIYTVIPYYVIRHEGSVEESKDKATFDTAIHAHFRNQRVLLAASSWYTETHTKILDLIFEKLNSMQLVVNGELHDTVCKFCENYFRAVSGMCHYHRSARDATASRAEAGRVLCAMKLLYKSDMDDVPPEVEAPYEVNLLSELSAVSET